MFSSVIIPTYDKSKRLELTLITLENQNYDFDNFEIIVVDDGSTDDTSETVKRFIKKNKLNLNYVYQENSGRAAARNAGIRRAKGKVAIFLDDDRLVCDDFIEQHVSFFREQGNMDLAILGKRMNLYLSRFEEHFESIKETVLNKQQELFGRAREEYYWRKAKETFQMPSINWIVFTTGNLIVSTEVLKKVGMFNENFRGWGLEDTELGYRIWKNKVPIMCNEKAVNFHIEHTRDHKQREEEVNRNHDLFYSIHNEQPVLLFRKFVNGEISLEDFNRTIEGVIEAEKNTDRIFYKTNKIFM